jgi:hypothetical protein
MKIARFLFVLILWAVLVHGTSLASQSGQVSGQTASQSGEKSTSQTPLDKNNKDSQVSAEKDQTGGHLDHNQKTPTGETRSTAKIHSAVHQAKPAPGHQARSVKMPADESLQAGTPLNVVDSHQTSSNPSTGILSKTVTHSSTAVPARNVVLNGQQIKNSREPGARLASSGGPANATRGTAAINGSDLKRKP